MNYFKPIRLKIERLQSGVFLLTRVGPDDVPVWTGRVRQQRGAWAYSWAASWHEASSFRTACVKLSRTAPVFSPCVHDVSFPKTYRFGWYLVTSGGLVFRLIDPSTHQADQTEILTCLARVKRLKAQETNK